MGHHYKASANGKIRRLERREEVLPRLRDGALPARLGFVRGRCGDASGPLAEPESPATYAPGHANDLELSSMALKEQPEGPRRQFVTELHIERPLQHVWVSDAVECVKGGKAQDAHDGSVLI